MDKKAQPPRLGFFVAVKALFKRFF